MFSKLQQSFKKLERAKVGSFGNDIESPKGRRAAMWHFHLVDHAFLRGLWTNLDQIAPQVWRSNQPGPARVERYAKMGIKTIINLRGTPNVSHYLLERQACAAHGIALESLALKARHAAKTEDYLALLDLFDRVEKPFLMHCKSGADRAGLASAFYLLHACGASVPEARKQLHIRYMHLSTTKTGVLDYLLDCFEADLARLGPIPLRDWLTHHYDRKAVNDGFTPRWGRK
ncbi:hypothetical protein AQS8620_01397 [Aquimixticola soesokkakensis]|uniref:Tyrosine specific protein phosphatases domain-containing protein n=1 Tax=Aquimixticola soesokkakensis TaxID=1519096 RepID=A0A1Y5SHF2_9RHOB|nr:tyrosine-protein phosphatase [Aquimixticola soesokkakensis]SLN37739.1 hypothetical protein AQS8620_01397 [Aquimixticola soesokkakensis]